MVGFMTFATKEECDKYQLLFETTKIDDNRESYTLLYADGGERTIGWYDKKYKTIYSKKDRKGTAYINRGMWGFDKGVIDSNKDVEYLVMIYTDDDYKGFHRITIKELTRYPATILNHEHGVQYLRRINFFTKIKDDEVSKEARDVLYVAQSQ
jgi:hypothetical protein